MVRKQEISKGDRKCGVFRQPRQDIIHGSVSECAINHDSLCKVSDFEISIHSKYNMPELYSVDGQGRAVYWLYKHSLADSESVRNSKTKSIDVPGESIPASSPRSARISLSSPTKRSHKEARINRRLSKLRDIIFSATSSDIEIKETYNSYIDLTDIETPELFLKNNEDIRGDKYDNLLMNLELRKHKLSKTQPNKNKKMVDVGRCSKRKEARTQYFETIQQLDTYCKSKRRKYKKYASHKDEKKKPLISKSTDTDLLRTVVESTDLDHILNQMRFFMKSGKLDNITEAQKLQLEGYLKLLTKESERTFVKNELYRGTINKKLKDSIKDSIRDIMYGTELKQASSLVVETDSRRIQYDSVSVQSTRSLKKSEGRSTMHVNHYSSICLPVLRNECPTDSYLNLHGDLIRKDSSEKEIKCEDLKYIVELNGKTRIGTTDNLHFKKRQSNRDNNLVVSTYPEKRSNSSRKSKPSESKNETMDKFKSVRKFDESDTFKYLEIRQREKSIKHKLKQSPPKSSENICLLEPDKFSYNEELDTMSSERQLPSINETKRSHDISTYEARPGTTKFKLHKSGGQDIIKETCQEHKRKYISNRDELMGLRKDDFDYYRLKRSNGGKSKKEKPNDSVVPLGVADDSYFCIKEFVNITDESEYDLKQVTKEVDTKIQFDHKIKSSSFRDAKTGERMQESQEDRHQINERRKKEKKRNEDDKITMSDNCISYRAIRPKVRQKYDRELAEDTKMNAKKLPGGTKTVIKETGDKDDRTLLLDIYAKDKNVFTISSYSNAENNSIDADSSLPTPKNETGRNQKETGTLTGFANYEESAKNVRTAAPKRDSGTSSHVLHIKNSLIHLDENCIFNASDTDSLENFLKKEVLGQIVPGKRNTPIDRSVNIPIYKQGYEIARITRQSPSCAYTLKDYVQKMNKSTQMFEHVTRNDLYTLQWIHDNLFEININPHTLIIDEKIKEVSEISDISS